MIWQGIDKRRFPRAVYPCKLIVLRTDLKNTFTTHTENIGAGGVCVIMPQELPKFCSVELCLYLKDGGVPVACNGRVVWSIKREKNFDTGVEFLDLREVDRMRIEKIIQECLQERS